MIGLEKKTYGNEEIRDLALVFEPGLAILGAAASDVSMRAVGNHTGEKDRVEPGEGAPVKKK